jgi:hypothetical protein
VIQRSVVVIQHSAVVNQHSEVVNRLSRWCFRDCAAVGVKLFLFSRGAALARGATGEPPVTTQSRPSPHRGARHHTEAAAMHALRSLAFEHELVRREAAAALLGAEEEDDDEHQHHRDLEACEGPGVADAVA